ncbi:hypothetical protein [Cardinium endosymbiont of Dermatophagoides farinae]|uniref:hypothetical protein n=1 Tax=Cardinium endosymbiont of Dermatophagoides farinae TaxID=2597823 RepID=UPI0011826C8A|nr:hypothetical protein [Cardinium endosymbiont of Dermatophagoides farinae]
METLLLLVICSSIRCSNPHVHLVRSGFPRRLSYKFLSRSAFRKKSIHCLLINITNNHRPSAKPICDQQFLGEAQSPEY